MPLLPMRQDIWPIYRPPLGGFTRRSRRRAGHLVVRLCFATTVLVVLLQLLIYSRIDGIPDCLVAAADDGHASTVTDGMLSTTTITTHTPTHVASHAIGASGRDCGTFTLRCVDAEGACNNACYAINCVNPLFSTLTYVGRGAKIEKKSNRQQAGAQFAAPKAGAVCGQSPFSQKLRDPAVEGVDQGDPSDAEYDTDEWPMAATIQADFSPGQIRNTLRCIPKSENSRAGGRFGIFASGLGSHQARTCTGQLRRGDRVHVDFDLSGADSGKLQYCLPDPDCRNDGYQFHLSALSRPHGRISFPYDPQNDNRYQLTRTAADEIHDDGPADIQQCAVRVVRARDFVSAEVFDGHHQSRGFTEASLFSVPDQLVVHGLHSPVTVTGMQLPDRGGTLAFRYASHPSTTAVGSKSFRWTSKSVGFGKVVSADHGRYCEQSEIDEGGMQTTYCRFPC